MGEDGQHRLTLRSQLTELARVSPWLETLTRACAIAERTRFAIDLCLEEALSNIVRHGYAGDGGQSIVVEFTPQPDQLIFTIEDTAPHFQPSADAPAPPTSLEEMTPGGLGLPLMRSFADAVTWEPLETGNRLTLVFSRRS